MVVWVSMGSVRRGEVMDDAPVAEVQLGHVAVHALDPQDRQRPHPLCHVPLGIGLGVTGGGEPPACRVAMPPGHGFTAGAPACCSAAVSWSLVALPIAPASFS